MRKPPETLRTAAGLIGAGLVPEAKRDAIERVAALYAIGVTGTVAGLINPADPTDPIARQFVPDLAELSQRPDEMTDPTGDLAFSPVEGIV
ncbi:MAG: lysine 2,3-aminomutase, partial [Methylocella sp.]